MVNKSFVHCCYIALGVKYQRTVRQQLNNRLKDNNRAVTVLFCLNIKVNRVDKDTQGKKVDLVPIFYTEYI